MTDRKPMSDEERERLREQLRRQDPQPFQDLLADALEQKPTAEDWRKLASSAPDKYTKALKQIGGLTGYSESLVVKHTHRHVLEALSDSELLAFLQEQRKALPLPILEAEAVPVETKSGPASVGPSDTDLRDAGVPKKDAA